MHLIKHKNNKVVIVNKESKANGLLIKRYACVFPIVLDK